MKRLLVLMAPLLLVAALVIACGGGGGGNRVQVDLKEWSVTPSTTTIPSGKVTFEAKNTGTIHHELRVNRVTGDQQEPIGVIEAMNPNESKSKEFTLTPGTYELSCQLADQQGGQIINHYQLGMHTRVTVQ